MKMNAEPNTPEDFDFIVTTGDNLRPKDRGNASSEEIDGMLNLFKMHPKLREIPVYPVRGNHDMPNTLE